MGRGRLKNAFQTASSQVWRAGMPALRLRVCLVGVKRFGLK
ncbi:hypothetical protein l13_02640 [Neisseria weaveri ATCC 51223]|nr:hypothetical protein l13_02640 [Neisseria weaveri ATCC 51223]